MNKILLASLIATTTMSMSAHAADTSRMFFQQTSTTTSSGNVSVDLEYFFASAGVATGIKVGAFGGEILLNSASDNHSGFANSSLGYKKSIGKNLSAYGIISYFDDGTVGNSATDFAIGAAYTMKSGGLTLNLNPELVTDDLGPLGPRAGKNTVFIKGLAAYKLNNLPVSLVAEIILDNNAALERIVNLGARWQPKNNLTIDLIVYSDQGASGPGGANVEFKSIPGYIIVNMLF